MRLLTLGLALLLAANSVLSAPKRQDFRITFIVTSATIDNTYCWMTLRFNDHGTTKSAAGEGRALNTLVPRVSKRNGRSRAFSFWKR